MTFFTLSKCMETKRLILIDGGGDVQGTPTIRHINGKDRIVKSAWLDAREKIDESKLIRVEGRGWFASLDDAYPQRAAA